MERLAHNSQEGRNLERLVRHGIKSRALDEAELKTILERMSDDELQTWWFFYSARQAFSSAEMNVPHWKTTEQEQHFKTALAQFMFHPQRKDANGRCIFERERFLAHIQACLHQHVDQQIKLNDAGKRKPFLRKVPVYIALIYLLGALAYGVAWLFRAFIAPIHH